MAIRSFIEGLSEEQRQAACFTKEPVLVLAGAGSGKTKTLMGRFAHLVAPEEYGGLGADPNSVMMVTFTNKAAREMRERIHPVLDDLRDIKEGFMGEPWIGTFHGLSLRILRIEADKAGLGKNFSIFDEADARSLANDIVEEMSIDSFDVDDFFKDLETAKARMLSPEFLRAGKAKIQSSGSSPAEDVLRWKKILANFESKDFIDIYARYQAALQEQNAVDFNDLLNRTTRLFQQSPEVRNAWRSTFRHFMVDEVQDINRAQVSWLQALTDGGRVMEIPEGQAASEYGNATDGLHEVNTYRLRKFPRPTIAFVGDDDQSIYAFRGSEVEVMRGLDQRFPGLDKKFLKTSYRCQPSILGAANALVAYNTGRFGKDLIPSGKAQSYGAVKVRTHYNPDEEIKFIALEAESFLADGGNASEFAVLTRTREHAKAVAKQLRASGLPIVEGKSSDLRKTAEVKDVMAFVTFLINPEAEVPLRRIINKPSRGLGPTSIRKVVQNAKLKGTTFLDEFKTILNNKIDVPDEGESYKPAFITSAKNFGNIIDGLKQKIESSQTAREGILHVLKETGYLDEVYRDALKSTGLTAREAEARALDPKEFIRWMLKNNKDINEKDKKQDLLLDGEDLADRAGQVSESARRIGNIALLIDETDAFESLTAFAQESVLEMSNTQAPSGIQVMTIHASKGLEFDHVRLPFWLEGVMPHGRAASEGDFEVEEERRLAYVSVTRARKTVDISRPFSVRGCPFMRMDQAKESRFITELKSAGFSNVQFAKKGDMKFSYKNAPVETEKPKPVVRERDLPDFKPTLKSGSKKTLEVTVMPVTFEEYTKPVSEAERFAEQAPLPEFEDLVPENVGGSRDTFDPVYDMIPPYEAYLEGITTLEIEEQEPAHEEEPEMDLFSF